jgi:diacylglycerol kinase
MKSDLRRFGRGFVYAWNGLAAAVYEERNIRFHLCAAAYAYAAVYMTELDATGAALVSLCVFAVIAMELMNSAVERAVNKPDDTHWWSAGAAKDMAAGGVLMMAVGAVCVGVSLFGNRTALQKIWHGICATPITLGLTLLSFVAAYFFIFHFGQENQKEKTDARRKKEQ